MTGCGYDENSYTIFFAARYFSARQSGCCPALAQTPPAAREFRRGAERSASSRDAKKCCPGQLVDGRIAF